VASCARWSIPLIGSTAALLDSMTPPLPPRRHADPASEAELERESEITERDLREDLAFWRAHGSALPLAMLDATEETDGGS
jgi:hypothetical protein